MPNTGNQVVTSKSTVADRSAILAGSAPKVIELKRGFTLVELLVAITIASVLTAIALPTLKDSMRQTTLSRSASLVKGAFINARSQAIRTGRPFGIVIERQRRRIGDGAPNTLNFTAANYATRLYYVQSSIEYRGDTQNAVAYPIFDDPAPVGGPLLPRFFFPQRSAGLLAAAAQGGVAAQSLLTVGTRFSVAETGYVFEVESATAVNSYATNLTIGAPAAPLFQYAEPGTIVEFNYRAFSPRSPTIPAVLTPVNPLPTLSTLQQSRFPGGLEVFKGYKFRFQTNPVRAPLAPVTLIGKSVIDLSVSGSASDPLEFGSQAILDTAPATATPNLAPSSPTTNPLLHDVVVMFAPDGKLDGIYFDRRDPPFPATNQPVTGFVLGRKDPASTVCFNVGFVDGILDNIDDGARYPGHVQGTDYQLQGNDAALAQPAPTADLIVDKVPNFANPDCAWISIQPLSGTISLDTVASQPPLTNFIQFYGFQAAPNSQSARNVMRSRLHQSRRLTSAGTVQ